MNWFQHNRWLGTFFVVFGIMALLCLLFLWQAHAGFAEADAALTESLNEQSRLERLNPFPNESNFQKMKMHLDNYRASLDQMKEVLKTRMLPIAPLAPNEFQGRLRQVTQAVLENARTNNVKLPLNFHLAFDEYTARLPDSSAAPLLGQELSQIVFLMDSLIGARVDGVISLRRTALPEESGVTTATAAPERSSSEKSATAEGINRNVVDLTFAANPAAARKVLNQIASSTQQFYIIRTLYVRNEQGKGPPREEGARANAPPAPSTALKFIVGNEHIEVSARIEMLRFNF